MLQDSFTEALVALSLKKVAAAHYVGGVERVLNTLEDSHACGTNALGHPALSQLAHSVVVGQRTTDGEDLIPCSMLKYRYSLAWLYQSEG